MAESRQSSSRAWAQAFSGTPEFQEYAGLWEATPLSFANAVSANTGAALAFVGLGNEFNSAARGWSGTADLVPLYSGIGGGRSMSGAKLRSSRFISNSSGATLDTAFFSGKTLSQKIIVVGRSGKGVPYHGTPNTITHTTGGHALVYGSKGKLRYDVSGERIKAIQWNKNPHTGKEFYNASLHDDQFYFREVPDSILQEVGLK